jgi:hypothetical protein
LKALAPLTRLTDLDLFRRSSGGGYNSDAVTNKSLREILAPLTGLTRLNLSGCKIGSLSERGLAEAVAPLTRLTTLLPPASAKEVFSPESEDESCNNPYSEDEDITDDEFRNNSSDDSNGDDDEEYQNLVEHLVQEGIQGYMERKRETDGNN